MLGLELVNKLGLGLVHKFSLTFILWNINLIISFKFEQPSDTTAALPYVQKGQIKRRFLVSGSICIQPKQIVTVLIQKF